MGIELKTRSGSSLQTLFARKPTEYLDCHSKREFIEKHGYCDRNRNRQALYTSFGAQGDSLGFSLTTDNENIYVMRAEAPIIMFHCDDIEEALLRKHSESAYVSVEARRSSTRGSECRFPQVVYCRNPSMRKFLRLLDRGKVNLDFTLSLKGNRIGDHGFLWKVHPDAIPELYLTTETTHFQ